MNLEPLELLSLRAGDEEEEFQVCRTGRQKKGCVQPTKAATTSSTQQRAQRRRQGDNIKSKSHDAATIAEGSYVPHI